MQQGSLPQFLSVESVTTAAAQMRRHAAQVRRRAAWCGMARRGALVSAGLPVTVPNLKLPINKSGANFNLYSSIRVQHTSGRLCRHF
jgi:hypothetical protein